MRIGVDYYPEHWDKALWEQDADLMRKTGVKVVRLAEFAWCRLEPQEGVYDFAWLDEAGAALTWCCARPPAARRCGCMKSTPIPSWWVRTERPLKRASADTAV